MSQGFARLTLILLALGSSYGHAQPCKSQVGVDLWAEEDQEIVGLDLAYSACPTWFGGVRFGLSYYADDEFLYQGLTGALRFQYGDVLSPFLGIGVLGGSAEKEELASADGLDNNANGFVDEAGEKRSRYEASAFLYPEVGIAFYTKSLGATLSARQYYGSEFTGNVIYSFGVSMALK